MSLIVEISAYEKVIGINNSLKNLANSVNSIFGGANTKQVIENTVCRGILQNDININFTNSWGQTAYQGLYSGLESISKTNVGGSAIGTGAQFSLDFMKGAVDIGSTVMNMGGVSLVGAGAASTRLYQGSSMSGFTTTMKWYTPKDDSYKDSLKALLILGFPSLRKEQSNNSSKLHALGKNEDGTSNAFGLFEKIPILGQIPNIITDLADSFSSLASYNPPTLMVRVVDPRNNKLFQLHPLVISNISFNSSRETFTNSLGQRIPIVISASVSFEFYQIRGNNGYVEDEFILAGVPVLGALNSNG